MGKRAQVAVGSVPGALLHRSCLAQRADDIPHQARGRRAPRFRAIRCVNRGSWIDPDAGKVTFEEYSARGLAERPHLRPRTRELYEGELRLHILPALGATELREITPSRIRTWRADMISAGKPGASTIAKCYRLVHAVFRHRG